MVKKTKKRKLSKSNKRMSIWLKKFWWIIIVVVSVIFISASMSIRASVETRLTRERFDRVNNQFEILNRSLGDSSDDIGKKNSIAKRCEKQYFGFNYKIECGTYVDLYMSNNTKGKTHSQIESQLKASGFSTIKFITASESANEGTISFSAEGDMTCSGYWNKVDLGEVRYSLFCRDYTSRFLDGYEVID